MENLTSDVAHTGDRGGNSHGDSGTSGSTHRMAQGYASGAARQPETARRRLAGSRYLDRIDRARRSAGQTGGTNHNRPVRPALGAASGNTDALYDLAARRYSLFNSVLSLGRDRAWRVRASRQLIDRGPLRILDAACGTGDQIIALFDAKLDIISVTGIDSSRTALTIAKILLRQSGLLDRVFLEHEPGDSMRFDDCTFDAATVGCGLGNLEHRAAVLGELWRVLKPESMLISVELTRAPWAAWQNASRFYTTWAASMLESIVWGSAQKVPSSPPTLCPAGDLIMDLRKAGFYKIGFQPVAFGAVSILSARKPAGRQPLPHL